MRVDDVAGKIYTRPYLEDLVSGDRGVLKGSEMRQCDDTPFPAALAVGSSLCVMQARPAM